MSIWAVLLVVVCAGCTTLFDPATPIPRRGQLIGVWEHRGPGANVAILDLKSDGTFQVHDIPPQVFALYGQPHAGEPLDWTAPVDLEGTWHTTKERSGSDPAIFFSIDPQGSVPGTITHLSVSGTGSKLHFYYVYGDPDNDNRFAFDRAKG